ncbi:uncharacterized protein [Aristolochia californica]|uniref:uncharacterized protein isoform X1 n=2 Tax=Aristolochia californica TaxID=171875 RepID=UPI0035E06BC3
MAQVACLSLAPRCTSGGKMQCSCLSVCNLHRTIHRSPTIKNYRNLATVSWKMARFCTVSAPYCTSLSVPLAFRSPSALVVAQATSDVPQRSEEWFALRRDKLTTSTFSTALGFWKGNRRSELWHEKVFATDIDTIGVAARSAMNWGVANEAVAIEQYKNITGREVGSLGFVVHFDVRLGWLGASPDGVLGSVPGGGILEVKCPYNKGKPESALPWSAMPYYYMPQLQGQMEIMDRDWVDLYCWTPNGSSLFRVNRQRSYWILMHGILQEFWWECVVPAREAAQKGRLEDSQAYEPAARHPQTGEVVAASMKLAAEATLICREIGGHLEFYW